MPNVGKHVKSTYQINSSAVQYIEKSVLAACHEKMGGEYFVLLSE